MLNKRFIQIIQYLYYRFLIGLGMFAVSLYGYVSMEVL